MIRPVAFTHDKRNCAWCQGLFTPTPTLSPHSTEHLCSAQCAVERHVARTNTQDPGLYEQRRQRAVSQRATERAAIAERLRAGRERAAHDEEEEVYDAQS